MYWLVKKATLENAVAGAPLQEEGRRNRGRAVNGGDLGGLRDSDAALITRNGNCNSSVRGTEEESIRA